MTVEMVAAIADDEHLPTATVEEPVPLLCRTEWNFRAAAQRLPLPATDRSRVCERISL